MSLQERLAAVRPKDGRKVRERVTQRWNDCAKPLGSLGLLETALEDIAALTGEADIRIRNRAVLVLCADNGVVAQGVTQSPASVTGIVARELAAGRTSVCRMAEVAGCKVVPVDVGIQDFAPVEGVLSRRIGNGTADISLGPAMTRAQAEAAIEAGIGLVEEQKRQGIQLLATGEMGIGNTTTSSAVACVLLDRAPEEMTGRGAGLSDEGLRKKIQVIHQALQVNRPDPRDPVDVLAKVGGFDLAGLCGVFLGGLIHQVPVLIDGVISATAALCAVRLCPQAGSAMLASHVSAEPMGGVLLEALGKKPLICAGMHLGEGTGAVAAMPLLDMAAAVYRGAYTFEEGGIEAYVPLGSDAGW